jgi:DNA-binding transcriptional LysR family regulator
MTGRLRIGFAASLAPTVLAPMLRAYRDRFPQVELELREMTTAPQIAALREHTIDVGLLRDPPGEEGLVTEEVLSEGFVAVLPAAHPLAAHRSVRVAALADEPFVLLPRTAAPTVHDRILEVCAQAGFQPRIAQRAVEWLTVTALVEAGLGVSLAPAGITRFRLSRVAYRRIDPDRVRTTVALCWRRDERGVLVRHFTETARAVRR